MPGHGGNLVSTFDKFCADKGVTIVTHSRAKALEDKWEHFAMQCQLTYQGRKLSTPFKQGIAHTKLPTAADVLACLLSDATAIHSTFEDWATDLGYNPDSIKALSTYLQCQKTATQLRNFLSKDYNEFEQAASEH
jgi:hypothetical protein